jgi:spore coat protein U domain-containing protein, fimbrial subunit CupE1/2/3/6
MIRRAWHLAPLLSLVALAWPGLAHAKHTCTLSTLGLAFGNYDPTSAIAVTTNGSISFTCTYNGKGFTATLTLSTGSSGSYTPRTLVSGTQTLKYNIYLNAADTEIFGDGTGSGLGATYYYDLCYPGGNVSCPGGGGQSGTQYVVPMYGLLPAAQDVPAGVYSDTIIATLTY